MSESFEKMSVIELRQKAKEMGVKLGAGINKQGIVEKLKEAAAAAGSAASPETQTNVAAEPAPAEPAVPRVTFTESLVATNGATLGVKLAHAALAPGESYALLRAPGTTLSALKANNRLSCETYGGVKGVFARLRAGATAPRR